MISDINKFEINKIKLRLSVSRLLGKHNLIEPVRVQLNKHYLTIALMKQTNHEKCLLDIPSYQ